MFFQEFQQSIHHQHNPKKAKKQYSAGFKKYHPHKHNNNQFSAQNTQAESDIFDQLKIGNLKQLYLQSQPVINYKKQAIQAQQLSIKRLTEKPENKKEQHYQQENDVNALAQNKQKFLEVYQKVQNFQETANNKLLKSQFNRIQQHLKLKLQQKSKNIDFQTSLIKFIIVKHKQILDKKIPHDQLYLDYDNYLNKTIKNQQKILKCSLKRQDLDIFLRKNFYLYIKFDLNNIKDDINFQNFNKFIRNQKQIDQMSHDQYALQLLNKRYTVPYESQLYKQSKSTIIDLIDKKSQQEKQEKYVFSANPVPKTTYQKPKERPKSVQKSKTVVQPFHITDHSKRQQKKMEEYYNWDRTFHAREIPKTTYEAFSINMQDQNDKKKRITYLLRSAAYPSTMNYLEDYKKHVQEQQEKLKGKYVKHHTLITTGDKVPNFDHLHKNQVAELQHRKAENRHLTVPQPFNLSQPKPRKQKSQVLLLSQLIKTENEQAKMKKKTTFNYQPQSTLKFQAYVNQRKQQKQQKLQQKEENKKKQQKMTAQKKVYKDILKQRIGQQLHNLPKTHNNPQPLSNNIIKVNLQKIYNIQPLLIQRQTKKSKKVQIQHKKNWDPII